MAAVWAALPGSPTLLNLTLVRPAGMSKTLLIAGDWATTVVFRTKTTLHKIAQKTP